MGLACLRRTVVLDEIIGKLAQPHQIFARQPICKSQSALIAPCPFYLAKNLELEKAQECRTTATGQFGDGDPATTGRNIVEQTFAVPGCQDQPSRDSEPQTRI